MKTEKKKKLRNKKNEIKIYAKPIYCWFFFCNKVNAKKKNEKISLQSQCISGIFFKMNINLSNSKE